MFKRIWMLLFGMLLAIIMTPLSVKGTDHLLKKGKITDPEGATKIRVIEAYGKLPLRFEANQGQVDRTVRFLSRGSGYQLFLTSTEAVLSLGRANQASEKKRKEPVTFQTGTLRMKWEGANQNPKVEGVDGLEGKSHYFFGNDPDKWRNNIPLYRKVRYRDLYSGIDLIYYGNQRQLEYDLVVTPEGDPGAIRLGIEGAEGVRVDEGGNLILRVGGGEVIQHEPRIYQEVEGKKEFIKGGYVVDSLGKDDDKGKVVIGFKIDQFDTKKPLIIDPVLVYSTYLGGSGYDIGNGIAVDSSGAAYITGVTQSTNFPTVNPIQVSLAAETDVFVSKLNPSGSALVYSTYLRGNGNDRGNGIAVDSSGSAYITGETWSNDFPTVNPIQRTYAGNNDVFVTKLSPSGSALVYSTYLGGSGYDIGNGIAVDSSGAAYITGVTQSTNFPTVNPIQGTMMGGFDVFVTELNPSGSAFVYSTYLGGSAYDDGIGIAVDSSGSAYITGETYSTNFPTVNPIQGANAGGLDTFVTKLNPSGSAFVYSTYLGGSDADAGNGIAVDSSGSAYITGQTYSINFPTVNPIQGANAGGLDTFVTKLNPSGSAFVYSTYLGGSDADAGNGIAVDSLGSAYITGQGFSTNFPTVSPIQGANAGGLDTFVTKLNPSGSAFVYSTYLGGSDADAGNGITVDSLGSAYITGQTYSTNFPTESPIQGANAGRNDAFVTRLDINITETISTPTKPAGPINGTTNHSYSYSTGSSTSNLGHAVEYQFDWKGDGTDLSLWGLATQSKSWTTVGTYSVKARARCTTDTFVVSSWSGALVVNIDTVSTPTTLSGPTIGVTGTPYSYTTGGSISSLGHAVEYQFDWKGDGSDLSPWGSATQSKTWGTAGTYNVRTKARCSVDTAVVSGWFAGLFVTITGQTQTIPFTIATNPSGLQIIVDGSTYTSPHTFGWTPGSSHTLSVTSPQSGTSGTRYVYSSWSDGGAQSHTVTVPSSSTTYTSTFNSQYELKINSSPLGGGAVTPSPMGDQSGIACVALVGVVCAGYYSGGASVTLTASPYSGYAFRDWSGDLTGAQNPVAINMNGPKNITANFSVGGRVINLPRTGQSKCYDSLGAEISCTGTEQDGELKAGVAWPDPRFTVSGDCVTDNLTGLMWSKNGNLPNGTRNWQGALNYVASINSGSGLCGYKDWRLPNVNEFESLVNAGEANSATWLISQGFVNVESVIHWTSTTLANDTGSTLVVGVWGGGVSYGPKSNLYYVWPVRSGQSGAPTPSEIWKTGQTTTYAVGDDGDLEKGVAWPSPRFTDNGNGTVTDKLTGLMWTKNANLAGGTKTWQQALDYVKTLSAGGHSDWRLPNRKELFSLIDYSKHNPPLPAEATQIFQNVQLGDYWSSTTYAGNTSIGWFVNMVIGYVYISSKSDSNYVWPVRSEQVASSRKPTGDFDGDGKTDITIWRPENGYWYTIRSSDQNVSYVQWGAEGDIPVPGDYDGDGKANTAVWSPSRCYWYIINSSDGTKTYTLWGALNDIPVPGDFDGDGKTDIVIWRPSNGYWYIIRSSDQGVVYAQWGGEGDIPVSGDFDGDGRTDIAIWKPSTGSWNIIRSFDQGLVQVQWGGQGDVPVSGDFDGDGKTDIAVWRPSNGYWYIIRSSDQSVVYVQWGGEGDIPIPGDYDGDGKTDIAVWRPSNGYWYIIRSSDQGVVYVQWGGALNDIPVSQ